LKIVNQKDIVWYVEPEGIISVDNYGRIKALNAGTATLKVSSADNSLIFDIKTVHVI
jgi:hypothetical protein